MVRRSLATAVVLSVAVCAPAAASVEERLPGAPAPPACAREGETVSAVGPFTAVLRLAGRLVACDRRTGARRLMVRPLPPVPNAGGGAYRVTVAGSLVAYASYSFCTVCGGGDTDRLRLFSVQRGPQGVLDAIHGPAGDDADVRVRAIALNECGTVAFVSAARSRFGGPPGVDRDRELRLWRRGDTGSELLERGPVSLASVKVTGVRVVWRSEGALRSHALRVACAHPTR